MSRDLVEIYESLAFDEERFKNHLDVRTKAREREPRFSRVLWSSGLRRYVQVVVSVGGVGSNPTGTKFFST